MTCGNIFSRNNIVRKGTACLRQGVCENNTAFEEGGLGGE